MNPNSNPGEDRSSRRRLIERLSGWRLNAFFVSAAVNLGWLVGLNVLPLFLDPRRLFVVAAWVFGSHAVFLIAVAGFRFPISVKFTLGFAHATACAWALASIDAFAWMSFGSDNVVTLYALPMLTMMVTVGGIVVARPADIHRSARFSVGDVMLSVSAIAVLLPLILRVVSLGDFTFSISLSSLWSAFAVAAFSGLTCLVVSNYCLNFIPAGQLGLSPLMMMIGWFLFAAIVAWTLCQFSFLIAIWILLSLVPVYGIANAPTGLK